MDPNFTADKRCKNSSSRDTTALSFCHVFREAVIQLKMCGPWSLRDLVPNLALPPEVDSVEQVTFLTFAHF